MSLEALSSEIASDSEADSRKSLRGGLGRASKLIDIEAHLRQLQYDPFTELLDDKYNGKNIEFCGEPEVSLADQESQECG